MLFDRKQTYHFTSVYGICLFLLSFTYGLSTIYIFSDNNVVHTLNIAIQCLIYPILIIIIFRTKYTLREIYLSISVVIIFTVTMYYTHSTSSFRYLLLFLASKNTKFTTILKSLLFSFSLILFLGLSLYIFRISNAGIGRRGAVALGFIQPNITSMIIITIFLLYLTLKNKLKISYVIWGLLLVLFIAIVLKSRTSIIMLILLPFIYSFVKKSINKNKTMSKYLMEYFQIVMLITTCAFLYFYPQSYFNPFRNWLDNFFSYRLYLNYNNVMQYGISLLGRRIDVFDTTNYAYNYFTGFMSNIKYNTVDCAYIMQLINGGIISMIPMYLYYIAMVKKAIRKKKYMVITISIICCLYAFLENNYNEAYYFFPYFYLMSIDNLPS